MDIAVTEGSVEEDGDKEGSVEPDEPSYDDTSTSSKSLLEETRGRWLKERWEH